MKQNQPKPLQQQEEKEDVDDDDDEEDKVVEVDDDEEEEEEEEEEDKDEDREGVNKNGEPDEEKGFVKSLLTNVWERTAEEIDMDAEVCKDIIESTICMMERDGTQLRER